MKQLFSGNWANYLDLRLEFDTNGSFTTQLYDKRDDFNFSIVNFPFIDSNIPESLHMVYLFLSKYGMPGFVPDIMTSCTEDPF